MLVQTVYCFLSRRVEYVVPEVEEKGSALEDQNQAQGKGKCTVDHVAPNFAKLCCFHTKCMLCLSNVVLGLVIPNPLMYTPRHRMSLPCNPRSWLDGRDIAPSW